VLIAEAVLAGFVVGSMPFGYVLVHLLGKGDIRSVGSGNIGATNVGRVLGPAGWTTTLLLDASKGVVGVMLGGWVMDGAAAGMAAGAAGAVLGHCYTPWLRGRGGKGVATMLGAFGYLSPVSTLVAVAGFVLSVASTRWVSLGSLVAAIALVVAMVVRGEPWSYAGSGLVVCAVVFIRHRENIARLIRGTETKVGGSRVA